MAVFLIPDEDMNETVSHLTGVHASVGVAASALQARAQIRLNQHRDKGDAKITKTEGTKQVDYFVNLEDVAAIPMELGHWVKGKYETETPKFVQGLHILSGAM